jgi:hypothetical protein
LVAGDAVEGFVAGEFLKLELEDRSHAEAQSTLSF